MDEINILSRLFGNSKNIIYVVIVSGIILLIIGIYGYKKIQNLSSALESCESSKTE